MPVNPPASANDPELLLRDLDCAVLNLRLKGLDDGFKAGVSYQTVRGVFQEGAPIYPGARIYTKPHVPIAVRDALCILGYFIPPSGDVPS